MLKIKLVKNHHNETFISYFHLWKDLKAAIVKRLASSWTLQPLIGISSLNIFVSLINRFFPVYFLYCLHYFSLQFNIGTITFYSPIKL